MHDVSGCMQLCVTEQTRQRTTQKYKYTYVHIKSQIFIHICKICMCIDVWRIWRYAVARDADNPPEHHAEIQQKRRLLGGRHHWNGTSLDIFFTVFNTFPPPTRHICIRAYVYTHRHQRNISRYILYRIRYILTPYKIYIYTCVCIYTSSSPKEWIPWYILRPNRFVPTLYMTCIIHTCVIHIAITQRMHLLIYSSSSSIHSRTLLSS